MKTILVVEDFAAVQRFLRETLESKGYRTIGAENAKMAYDMLINLDIQPGLVLPDYHMPEGTGLDLAKQIKANPDLAKIPVIYLTTETNPEIIKTASETGFTAWIKKPYRPDVLLSEVEKVFNGR